MTARQPARVALVTGAASGIGAATAHRLADDGARVVLADVQDEAVRDLAARLGGLGVVADVATADGAQAAVDAAVQGFGGLDCVVACAGGDVGNAALGDTDDDAWSAALSTNLGSAVHTARAALPALARRRGSFTVVASIGALISRPGVAGYATAKAAAVGLIRSIAVDYGPAGVRANAVLPGLVGTPMADGLLARVAGEQGLTVPEAVARITRPFPLRRLGRPEEIASVCAFLAGDRASFVTGAALVADGGATAMQAGAVAFLTPEDPPPVRVATPLHEQVALVTGAASGIGAATARLFAAAGARVALLDIQREPLEDLAAEIGGIAVVGDAADPQVARAAVAAATQGFGRLDALIACAGGDAGSGRMADVGPDNWELGLRDNLHAAAITTRAALPALAERGGAVVLVSSTGALAALPGSAALVTAKAGLLGLTRSAAVDYGPLGVRINAVCPGWVRSPTADRVLHWVAEQRDISYEEALAMTGGVAPLRRGGTPEELAAVCLFLASPDASFVTGATLPVDGGTLAVNPGTVPFTS